jgi:hypothetical protein
MKKLLPVAILTLVIVADLSGQTVTCPTVEVVGPAGVTAPGEAMFYRADVSGAGGEKVTSYKWTVSAGTIADGQGTDQIRIVSTREQAGSNITATVTVKGPGESCVATASETAPVMANIVSMMPADEYGETSWEEERARFDNLLIQLNHDPKLHAFIQMAVPANETLITHLYF